MKLLQLMATYQFFDVSLLESLGQKLRSMDEDVCNLRTLAVDQTIDRFYYMQKATEIDIRREQFTETLEKLKSLDENITKLYEEVLLRWSSDTLWLSEYLTSKSLASPVAK